MKIILALLLSLFVTACFLINFFLPIVLIFLSLYIWLLFKYPEVGLFIVVLTMNDFFSLFSSDVFRLPGIFRIRDVFFVLAFIPLLFNVRKGRVKRKPVLLSKAIWFIVICTLVEIIFTIIFEKQGLNFTLRMARRYLYYLIYFPLVYLIDDSKKFKRFVTLIVVSAIIYSFLMIIQFLVGPNHVIFQYASSVGKQEIAGSFVTRAYAIGASIAIIVFFFYLFKYLEDKKKRYRSLFIALLTFSGGVYLQFGRANIFGVLAGLVFSVFIFKNIKYKVKFIFSFLALIVILLLIFEGVKMVSRGISLNPLEHTYKAILSGANDLINRTGTFRFRLKDSAERIDLIKNHLFFGIGFVHPESNIIRIHTLTSGIVTSDSGLITLLLDFGLLGVLWLTLLTMAFFKGCRSAFCLAKDNDEKILVLAVFAYYFSRLFSFLTLCEYVNYSGIVTLCVAFFILNYILRDSNGPLNNNS